MRMFRSCAWPALVAVLTSAMLEGCSSDCGCDQRYRECIEKAPPGAAKADCAKEQDDCERACDEGRTSGSGAAAMR